MGLFDGKPLTIEECDVVEGPVRARIKAAMEAKHITTHTTDEGWQNTNDWCHYYRVAKSLGLCTDAEYDRIESSFSIEDWFRSFKGGSE